MWQNMCILFFSLEYVNMPSLPVYGIYSYIYSQDYVDSTFLLESVAISPLSGICRYAFSSRNLWISLFSQVCGYLVSTMNVGIYFLSL